MLKNLPHWIENILWFIYYDLIEPIRTPSMRDSKYFVVFIDDYFLKSWIYFLQWKDEIYKKFRKFKNQVKKKNIKSNTITKDK